MSKKVVIKLVLELPDDVDVSIAQCDCETHAEADAHAAERAKERTENVAEKIREGKPKRIPVAKLEELIGPEIDDDNKFQLI